ncbi:MAG: hypothetical protein JW760_12085 [Spirochaetales bacterium]|nr:hypothetical protein [Spirochaetales bacterium]
MLTKLTLTIEESIIAGAKEYSRKKNKSISRIVSEYLNNLSDNAPVSYSLPAPITDSLVGSFEDPEKDYKTLLEEALAEKYP